MRKFECGDAAWFQQDLETSNEIIQVAAGLQIHKTMAMPTIKCPDPHPIHAIFRGLEISIQDTNVNLADTQIGADLLPRVTTGV